MLFPFISQTDGLPPGITEVVDAPLAPARKKGLSGPNLDPADGLVSPASIWIARRDARPVLFAYVKDNYVVFVQRIAYTSLLPIGWRVDTPDGRIGKQPATIWVFALDLSRQGLLLGAKYGPCPSNSDRPVFDTSMRSRRRKA
jgi:hypothetical protein